MQNPHIESISIQSLIIQIRYLQGSVDLNYTCNEYSLRQLLQQHVRSYLESNTISVKCQEPELMIMKDIHTVRSLQMDSYRFSPFCDCLQIYIVRKDLTKFTKDFKVQGDITKLQFQQIPLNLSEWHKCSNHLTPQTPITDFISYICKQHQLSYQNQLTLIKAFSSEATTVQDIITWDREHLASLNIKRNIIEIVRQNVEEIRNRALLVRREQSEGEKDCVKVGNSHKVLRYLVGKVRGTQQLRAIPWVNYENLKKAFNLMSKIIVNQSLFKQLEEYFCQFTLNPQHSNLFYSRGMILHGPPGTGKTLINELLPKMIGIHPISHGLSAADFMKSLVGQTSRMIKDLGNRAALSPHLLCFLSIDDFDLLVPDRNIIENKNNETLSALLSTFGGNRDVPNLILTASTNYLQKLDWAISSRIKDHFKVDLPSQFERAQILFQSLQNYYKSRQLAEGIAKITQNFSGAALKHLAGKLITKIILQKMKKQMEEVSFNEIEQTVKSVSQRFKLLNKVRMPSFITLT